LYGGHATNAYCDPASMLRRRSCAAGRHRVKEILPAFPGCCAAECFGAPHWVLIKIRDNLRHDSALVAGLVGVRRAVAAAITFLAGFVLAFRFDVA
jgi:hypothetical protein